jgi:hypothetical protein
MIMRFNFGFFDIGIGDWPYPHTINIGQGIIEIMPWKIMISMEWTFFIIGFTIFTLTILRKEFLRGYRGL